MSEIGFGPKSLVPAEFVERAVGVLVTAFGWHRPAADDAATVILSDAAPHIDRAARIDELKKLAAEVNDEIKCEYTEVLPGGPTVTREGWALYMHYCDLLEKIADVERSIRTT